MSGQPAPGVADRLATPTLDETETIARILWQNAHLLIWDKPAGLPVHPGFGGGVTLGDYLPWLREEGAARLPALLHRLDRETGGCLALGRTDEALRTYGQLFERREIHKSYYALVFGAPFPREGVIHLPLRQERVGAGMRGRVDERAGQPAETHYRTLAEAHGLSLVEAEPKTGRMHQIRLHLSALGCPIAGDRLYGGQSAEWPQLMLHAAELQLPRTALADAMRVRSAVPALWAERGFTPPNADG